MKTIMLTSAGGLVGTYLIKHFRETTDYRIVAVDCNELCPAKLNADVFYLVPRVNEDGFAEKINQIFQVENCDALIPVSSYDVKFFSENREKFPMRLLIIEKELNNILNNKETCYPYLNLIGINTPLIYKTTEEVVFPCVIKPKQSSGTKNTEVLFNIEDLDYYTKKFNNYLLCEFLEGDEYTVDCLFDWNGKALGYNPRQRQKTVSGGSVISRNSFSEDVREIIEAFEKTGKIIGPVNFQYKRKNGVPIIFDVNTRLPSGGLPLTVKSGFDIPNLMIRLLLQLSVDSWDRDESMDGLTMIRFYDELFIKS